MRTKYTKVKKMWADMGYQGRNLKNHIKEEYDIDIEIVKRPPCRFWVHKDTPPELLPTREQGFKVQPRRWVVERTFAWVNRNRRLSKECLHFHLLHQHLPLCPIELLLPLYGPFQQPNVEESLSADLLH